ncbi:MAG: hypothetical protein J6X53_10345 [Abditibacteriota bacterium]|nr:hypothetical protein [Abditibacteriota bacterium]
MELLGRAGCTKFPDSERFVSDQSVIAYLRAWQTRYREGSPVYSAISDIVRGIGDSREIPTAAYIRRGVWKEAESGSVYCGTCGYTVKGEAGNFCPNCGSCMNDDITDVCSRYNG